MFLAFILASRDSREFLSRENKLYGKLFNSFAVAILVLKRTLYWIQQ